MSFKWPFPFLLSNNWKLINFYFFSWKYVSYKKENIEKQLIPLLLNRICRLKEHHFLLILFWPLQTLQSHCFRILLEPRNSKVHVLWIWSCSLLFDVKGIHFFSLWILLYFSNNPLHDETNVLIIFFVFIAVFALILCW